MFRTKINNLPLAQVRSLVTGVTPAVAKGASEDLTGSVFDLVLDDEPVRAPRLRYEITGADTLLYAEDGRAPLPCPCAVLTLKDMVLFTHAVPDAMNSPLVATLAAEYPLAENVQFVPGSTTFPDILPVAPTVRVARPGVTSVSSASPTKVPFAHAGSGRTLTVI